MLNAWAWLAVVAMAGLASAWLGMSWADRRALRRADRVARASANEINQLRDRLAASSATLGAVFSAVQEAVVVLDAELNVVAASESAARLFALEPSARTPLLTAIRSAELRDLLEQTASDWQGLGPMTLRYAGRLLEVAAAPLAGGGRVLVARDRTAHERLERARRDLVANVSHDLRTPLTSITLLAESLLAEPHWLSAEAAPLVQQLRAQVATLTHLADGLIDLDRIESGRAPFRLEATTLRPMVDEAIGAVAPLLAERAIDVRVAIDPTLRVLADRRHVVRLIVNLVDNARHASQIGATIEVGAESDDDGDVRFWVADDGPGIAPSERTRVFERFYRGDRARAGTGSGLGLAIAKHIAEGHGGAIWIADARGACSGATVHVRLLGAPEA